MSKFKVNKRVKLTYDLSSEEAAIKMATNIFKKEVKGHILSRIDTLFYHKIFIDGRTISDLVIISPYVYTGELVIKARKCTGKEWKDYLDERRSFVLQERGRSIERTKKRYILV